MNRQPQFLNLQPTIPCFECRTYRPGLGIDFLKCVPCKTVEKPLFIEKGIEDLNSFKPEKIKRIPHSRGAYRKYRQSRRTLEDEALDRGYLDVRVMLLEMYEKEKSVKTIADMLGCSWKTIGTRLHGYGVQLKRYGFETLFERYQAVNKKELFEKLISIYGNNYLKIAKAIGMTRFYLRKQMVEEGFSPQCR